MSGTRIKLKDRQECYYDNNKWSFEDVITRFVNYCEIKNLRAKTIKNYQENYHKFWTYIKEYTLYNSIDEVRQEDVDGYILYLKSKGIKETSINSYLRGLRAILNFCSNNNMCNHIKIHIQKADKSIKGTYTDDELFKLLQKPCLTNCEFTTYRNWCIINFFLATGVRVSTLVHIKIEDIDLTFDRIHLTYTKNRRSYIIPLSAQLKNVLQEYLSIREGEPQDYLFCNQYGEQLTTDAVKHAISKYNKSRGVNRTGLHAFRHTFAKRCVLNDVNVFVLQKLLGHTDISITREYVELYADDLAYNIENYNPLDTLWNMPTKNTNNGTKKKRKITMK